MTSKEEECTLRFAVGSKNKIYSSVWRLWTEGDDIYLGTRSSSRFLKFSLHASGDYRLAINSNIKRNPEIKDRVLYKWRRPSESNPGLIICLGIIVPPSITKRPFGIAPAKEKIITYIRPSRRYFFPWNASATFFFKNPRERFEIVGSIPTATGIVWIISFLESITKSEDAVLQGYFDKLKIQMRSEGNPKDFYSGTLNAIEESPEGIPFLIDIQIGEENLEIAEVNS